MVTDYAHSLLIQPLNIDLAQFYDTDFLIDGFTDKSKCFQTFSSIQLLDQIKTNIKFRELLFNSPRYPKEKTVSLQLVNILIQEPKELLDELNNIHFEGFYESIIKLDDYYLYWKNRLPSYLPTYLKDRISEDKLRFFFKLLNQQPRLAKFIFKFWSPDHPQIVIEELLEKHTLILVKIEILIELLIKSRTEDKHGYLSFRAQEIEGALSQLNEKINEYVIYLENMKFQLPINLGKFQINILSIKYAGFSLVAHKTLLGDSEKVFDNETAQRGLLGLGKIILVGDGVVIVDKDIAQFTLFGLIVGAISSL
ncbi:hypothetical protein K502DRAFT_353000 [Neoconidiobolus thromboides FSU 785]|nr:hypothetical protein K502DRAFT_353000 [Neoconidiobolus thromboides FSU 785]